jgi:hypothetical protein
MNQQQRKESTEMLSSAETYGLLMIKLINLNIFNLKLYLDYLFKFLVIGSAGVGKSCVLYQFIENKCI